MSLGGLKICAMLYDTMRSTFQFIMKKVFAGKQVLVTGGLGFIGSNLAIDLVKKGAAVTIVDNMMPQLGGNLTNITPVKNDVTINYSDVRDPNSMNYLVQGKDYIFHLARQTDHILSQTDPYPDIDVNIRGTAVLLEACKHNNPTVRLIYIGTRGQYGKAVTLPVREDAPTNPRGMYELTNLAAEKMIQIYNDVHKIQSVMLRLTNIYGPRSQMRNDHYGVVNWFIRLAMEDKMIPVFGDGMLKRDFLYVDDATRAILLCAATHACYGQIINVGRDRAETFLELVQAIVKAAKSGTYKFTPFTRERASQEPGDFISDISKITRLTGWKPKTPLHVGLTNTIRYYKRYRASYW